MRSCDDATYVLQHCPNTRMDGDGDGVPCEQQWCH
ncbi:excalibur calcium-binding domain-containing protein [Xanthomonas sp. NCPPB 1067]|nr:excalibur calcium-binding domain-containing protein [Xanthomonas sp. NCPPB 1067]